MADNIITVTDSTFQTEVLDVQHSLVLVDFWAPWCGPCVQFGKTLEEYAMNNSSSIKLCKVNVDENTEIPSKLGIRGIPAILLYKNGEKVDSAVGAMNLDALTKWISEKQ